MNTKRINYHGIVNYLENRSTNASAESLNAKIKAFRSQFRGVRNIEFRNLINPHSMKTLLSFLGIILMLASCGSNESETALSTVNVNGREVSTVKIGNLGVMTEDLGEMTWNEAMEACADLGVGWRLPRRNELQVLYNNRDKIGGFDGSNYWSSTEKNNNDVYYHSFVIDFQSITDKYSSFCVRAVRAF